MNQTNRFFWNKDKNCLVKSVEGTGNCLCAAGFEPIDPSKSEGAGEKHLPVISKQGDIVTVSVGSVFHPMSEEHSIGWVVLETEQGEQFKRLRPDGEPVAKFALLPGDRVVGAYAYCNLHGLWRTTQG